MNENKQPETEWIDVEPGMATLGDWTELEDGTNYYVSICPDNRRVVWVHGFEIPVYVLEALGRRFRRKLQRVPMASAPIRVKAEYSYQHERYVLVIDGDWQGAEFDCVMVDDNRDATAEMESRVPREWNGELTEFKDGSFLCMRSVVPEPSGVIKVHIIEVIE